MFKKLKDKLAEEVKSSPQRIQLFAQAAQAAVTSASSSISDITNSDLFSIGDNDGQQSRLPRPQASPTIQQNMFQDVSLRHAPESVDYSPEVGDGHRQRRLSNSSFASDVSFRLPSYESPSTYHLQSDMEVSASEADDRGFSGGPATLDRVTKEQLYAAYKRTQERYKKYRTQYGDLARHYKLLERENAKARSVLVETQDKALRRISELKEQCTLEQSAKAHLEKALRVEIEEKNMKIESLNTKVHLLQNNSDVVTKHDSSSLTNNENEVELINLDHENTVKLPIENSGSDATNVNNKIEKMEQLLNKYKESLKTSKEKNSQISTDLQILSKELEDKNRQIQYLQTFEGQLNEANTKIQELNNLNEELQNQINTFDFTKTKELSTLEVDLQKANEEVAELRGKVEVFTKREEEYAISLAENKLSIHKELESKEAEINSLKDNLSASKKEIQSLQIVVDAYKDNISVLEEEKLKLNNDCTELSTLKSKITELDSNMQELSKKTQSLEQLKAKADEEYKFLQLQLKQETAEKLAMIDRNVYLESKNTQLVEENTKKSNRISNLESELQKIAINKDLEKDIALKETEKSQILAEMNSWKEKCGRLEFEIQEERDELAKLQTEIEKLLNNHELIQAQNAEFRLKIADLTSKYSDKQEHILKYRTSIGTSLHKTLDELKELRLSMNLISNETKTTLDENKETFSLLRKNINSLMNNSIQNLLKDIESVQASYNTLKVDYDNLQKEVVTNHAQKSEVSKELDMLQNENQNLKIKLQEKEVEYNKLNDKLDKMSLECESFTEKMDSLKSENNDLTEKIKNLEVSSQQLRITLENETTQHLASAEKLKMIGINKQHLQDTIQTLESSNTRFNLEIDQLKQQSKDTLDEMKSNYENLLRRKEEEMEKMKDNQNSNTHEQLKLLYAEKDELNKSIQVLENKNSLLTSEIEVLNKELNKTLEKLTQQDIELHNKCSALENSQLNQISLEKEVAQYVLSFDTVRELENEKHDYIEKLKCSEDSIRQLSEELDEYKRLHTAADGQIKEINDILINQSKECNTKQQRIDELEENIRTLTQENISLKTETSNFVSNIKKLETEIDDIKISHAEMVIEKDRLNGIIEELGNVQKEYSVVLKDNKDTQTDGKSDIKDTRDETSAVLENKWVKEHKQSAMCSTVPLNLKKENLEDMYEQYSSLKINFDSLKDENRRLQSDIEGLQSYLTKISKENSVLNDKLRELIATSEHSTDNDQLSSDVKTFKNEVHESKEKINDLLRENSLLIEENLELKDQLQSQNYSKLTETKKVPDSEKDDTMKLKYNDLMQSNSQLQKQNVELDQINKSVSDNMQQLHEKNERLKRSNEKLERRLDEALVSLRHLHSLQENTELEYLRNILYEYLTGSGTHSVTLAKVLAAIVKFDDVQTQMVLQKEKERQGFLRQLGII